MPRSLAALLLLVCSISAAFSEPEATLVFERLEDSTGPSHNSIFAIAQDRQGFVWLGTQDGLDRYDGHEFVVFRHDPRQPDSLSANRVNAVLEDRRGRLWVGTLVGIDRLDRRTGRFGHYLLAGEGEQSTAAAYELVEDRWGRLWAGTAVGLWSYDETADRWRRRLPQAPPQAVSRVRVDRDGGLWLRVWMDGRSELWRVREERIESRVPVTERALGLDLGPGGEVWIDSSGPLRPQEVGAGAAGPREGPVVITVRVEPSGEVWLGTADGVLVRDASTGQVAHYLVEPANALSNTINVILRDRAGAVWIGTENGLYRNDPYSRPFRHLRAAETPERAFPVSALAEVRSGTIWVGTFGAGLFRLEPGGDRLEPVPAEELGLPTGTIWSLLASPSGLWVGGPDMLCRLRFGERSAACEATVTGGGVVAALARGEQGDLWAIQGATLRRRTVDGRWSAYTYTGERDVFGSRELTFLLPTEKVVWIGTWGGALKAFHIRDERFEVLPRVDAAGWEQVGAVLDLYLDGSGVLWMGTTDGLSRYEPETGRFQHYGQADGLPGSNVYSIVDDAEGRLWLGTNRGLARFDPAAPEGNRFRSFGKGDGVVNVEFNRHARLVSGDGRFLFGGSEGVTQFSPDSLRDNPFPPPVALTGIEILGRSGPRRAEPFGLQKLVLGPADSAVTFDFVALDYTSPLQNRHAYRLEGFDDDWVEAGSGRSARYTNLPPGHYVFRARGANGDGVWNEQGLALPVVVLPPFWRTWWFRLVALALVAVALAAAYRLRVRRLIALERVRLRIAGDLHDDLGSELSGIALTTSRLLGREGVGPEERQLLEDVLATTRQVTQGLRDIVWYVSPEHDNLEALIRRMRALASSLLAEVDLQFEAETGAGAPDLGIDMTVRRQLFLIYKEVLNNIVRHAKAASVRISVWAEQGAVRLEIEDDGVGFDPEAPALGSGLHSLRRRAGEIGAHLEIDSRPEAGTRVRLLLGMTRRRQGEDDGASGSLGL